MRTSAGESGREGGSGEARAGPGWAGVGMEVSCPACAARYLLPGGLLGPWGARVRCRGCGERFQVRVEGERLGNAAAPVPVLGSPSAGAHDPGPPAASDAAPGPSEAVASPGNAAELAERILDGLEERCGARIRQAHARGRLFSECGPELLEAFDAFQRGAGPGGEARVFRRALRRRWGIELEAGA